MLICRGENRYWWSDWKELDNDIISNKVWDSDNYAQWTIEKYNLKYFGMLTKFQHACYGFDTMRLNES